MPPLLENKLFIWEFLDLNVYTDTSGTTNLNYCNVRVNVSIISITVFLNLVFLKIVFITVPLWSLLRHFYPNCLPPREFLIPQTQYIALDFFPLRTYFLPIGNNITPTLCRYVSFKSQFSWEVRIYAVFFSPINPIYFLKILLRIL